MRSSLVWAAVMAIAAPLSLSLPVSGKTYKASALGTEPLSLSKETAAWPRKIKTLPQKPPVQAEPIWLPKVIVQIPTNQTTPETNQSLPNTPGVSNPGNAPQTPPPPVIPRTPGTEGAPQQDTPNQIQIPITPGTPSPDNTPDIENNINPPSAQPSNPAAPGNAQPSPTPGSIDNNANPPSAQPSNPAAPGNAQPSPTTETPQPRVLVSEVVVRNEQGQLSEELQNQVYKAITTQPGRTATRSQLQEDINRIFATGFFSNVRAVPEDTPLGVRVSFVVQPNPVLRNVQVQANPGTGVPSVLPESAVQAIFREQYGSILNLRRFQEGIKSLNKLYQDKGYVLAQVTDTQVAADGTVILQVAEGVVEDIQVRFINKEGESTNEKGEPINGRTRNFIITRELELKPGQVFNRATVQRDLQRVYGLGLFEDVNVALNPATDPGKVVVVVNVNERNSGSVAAGLGLSSASGLFGTLSYQQQNLGGNDQNLAAEVQVGTTRRELLFDLRFTDPWIAGDPYRTSYTLNVFSRRSLSLIFDGPDDDDIEVPGEDYPDDNDDFDRPRVRRLGGGITFTRPLSRNPLERSEWTASAGLEYQRVSIRNGDGDLEPEGRFDERDDIPLSFSGEGQDDLLTVQLGVVRDLRNNLLQPTRGSLLRFGVEQSIPVGLGNILLSRLRGSYSQYIPVSFINLTKGPQTIALNLQAGTILGDLPPYEAFSLGGTNSVRGYEEGDLGSGRSFVQATAEYRFPIFSSVGGVLFFDAASDLGTGGDVPGRPAEVLGKPGSGFGYGIGVRVQSPVGPIRVDYGLNDDGDSRIHFGISERF